MSICEVVLTNYKRKQNLPQIVEAFRQQNVPVTITLIDNAHPDERVDDATAKSVDKYFHIFPNPYRCFIRHACFGFYNAEYILIHDDDMVPGKRNVEHYLKYVTPDRILGQIGRKICPVQGYNFDAIQGTDDLVPVDLVIRSYFFHISTFSIIHEFKRKLIQSRMGNLLHQDDMLLAVCRKGNVFVTPQEEGDTRCNIRELDASSGEYHYPDRQRDRTRTWQLLNSLHSTFIR